MVSDLDRYLSKSQSSRLCSGALKKESRKPEWCTTKKDALWMTDGITIDDIRTISPRCKQE